MDCLNSLGVRPSAALSNAGLTWQDLFDSRRMVGFSIFRRFVAYGIQSTGEPALGLMAGSMLQPYHTPVGIGAVTGKTLGQGLEFLSQHASLIFGSFRFRLENGSRWSTLEVKPLRHLCETHIFVIQSIVGSHCRLLEAMLGRPADELVVGLPYPRPPGDGGHCLRYVRKVEFDGDCLRLQMPVELLRLPCASEDAEVFAEASKVCERVDAELQDGAFVQRVRRFLLQRLVSNPGASELASDLGISARTLVRRLAEAGVSYADIKEDLRKTHATWYLQHTELSIEEIASQLGYSDPHNFGRKFKHWYRVAPSKMRRSLRMELHDCPPTAL
ncbi:helix-turn-helix domain-containing protein [Variovorax sp. HW608]|uniref:helix-turn-helix domain-containing protein n=1 Tax=Variovorax sp. HW608 TaxID=1034889 RepID=UPI003FCCE2FF